MKNEVIQKSEAHLQNFPTSTRIPGEFYIMATILAEKFEELFQEHNDFYYIKDQSINHSFMNQDKNGLITSAKELLTKMKNDENSKKDFWCCFKLPNPQEIANYEELGSMSKGVFLNLAKIRKVAILEQNNSIKKISCTCPDFLDTYFRIHQLSLGIKKGFWIGKDFKKNKKRGPIPKLVEH